MKVQKGNAEVTEYMRKDKKTKKKENLRLMAFLQFIFVFGMLAGSLIMLALSPLFEIHDIYVRGNSHYSEEDIIDASGIILGTNGFKLIGGSTEDILNLRNSDAENTIKKELSYIKDVVVKFALTDKIIITVKERKPFAVVPFYGTSILVDDEAYVLETFEGGTPKSLPVIKGLKFDSFEIGQALELESMDNFFYAVNLINEIVKSDSKSDFKLFSKIDYFDVHDIDNICILYDSRIVVNLGNLEKLSYRIDFAKEILKKNIREDEKGQLDFTLSENPSFIPSEY